MKPYITKKQYDQLVRIAPNYARLLRKGIMPRGDQLASVYPFERLDMNNGISCLVGETYFFTNNYANECNSEYCSDCDCYSVDLCSYNEPLEFFRNVMDEFLKHYKTEHENRMLYRE